MTVNSQEARQLLHALETCLKTGSMTPAREVEDLTVVCSIQEGLGGGNMYYQSAFDALPDQVKKIFAVRNAEIGLVTYGSSASTTSGSRRKHGW